MICSVSGNSEQLTVTLRAQPRLRNLYDLTWPLVFIAFVSLLHLPTIALAIFITIFLFREVIVLQRMFGKSVLATDDHSVMLTREILGLKRHKRFLRDDVEALCFQAGYSVYKGGDFSSCLCITAKSLMTPCQFGITIQQEEAEKVFTTMKESGSWLAERIRPITTQK
jgi:hypothetical protein